MNATQSLDEARAQGFVVVRSQGGPRFARQFWDSCTKTDEPYICITLYLGSATVEMDLLAQTYRLNEQGEREVTQAIPASFARAPLIGAGRTVCMFERVPNSKASEVAQQLLAIISKPENREPAPRKKL